MAYPDLYDVTYSYTAFQQAQGDNSFPGTQLDADLAGLQTTIQNVDTFVQSVMRSDGALNNGIVTFDSLAAGLQTNGITPANAWATGVEFAVGTAVVQNGSLYRALVAHTSGVFATDLAAGKWLFVTSLPSGSFVQAGAGAVTRTMQDKARDSVSVKDFGAVGDGVANDTAAFTAAGSIAQFVEVRVPAGTYLLSTSPAPTGAVTWTIHAGATLTGSGVLPGRVIQNGNLSGTLWKQTFSGATNAPNLATLYPNANTFSENTFEIVDTTGLSTSSGAVNGLTIQQSYGGANVNSIRQTLYVQGNLTAPSSNTNGNYVAGTFFQAAGNNDGGTGGSPRGAFFGINPVAYAYAAATNLQEVASMEVNIGMETGSSAVGKAAISIVQLLTDRVSGSSTDSAIWVNNQGASSPGWSTGILFEGNTFGTSPSIKAVGSILQTRGAATITSGVDISSFTIAGNAWSSPGATISGSGMVGSVGTRIRAGTGGAPGASSAHNIFWTGTAAQLWIDSANVGSITLTSDYRIKKDVKDAGSVLEEVRQWRPITYTGEGYGIYTANEDVRHSFIAHELKAVSPDCVVGEKDGEQLQSLDLVPIISRLAKALQELDAKVASLEAKLAQS